MVETQQVVPYCHNRSILDPKEQLPAQASNKETQQTSKLCTGVCRFSCGCPLPPDVFPSQMHCCLQIQAALKGICLELYSRGQIVSSLMIASIFWSSAMLAGHSLGLAPAEHCQRTDILPHLKANVVTTKCWMTCSLLIINKFFEAKCPLARHFGPFTVFFYQIFQLYVDFNVMYVVTDISQQLSVLRINKWQCLYAHILPSHGNYSTRICQTYNHCQFSANGYNLQLQLKQQVFLDCSPGSQHYKG